MSVSRVLINPNAGGGRASRLRAPMAHWLAHHSPQTSLVVPPSVEQARAYLRELPRASRVVVVGGDGTLNQLLGPLLEGEHCLGLVPCGSGNDAARSLGLHGLPWQTALVQALRAPASRIDHGVAQFDRIGSQGIAPTTCVPFLSSLTVGFDASVGLRALNGPRWLRGLPRYLLATLRELVRLRNWCLQVRVDGRAVYSGGALFASTLNTRSFGSGMPAVPHALIDDGKLDLLLAGKFGRGPTLLMLPRLLSGLHLAHPRVLTCAYEQMQLASTIPIPIAADGEYLGEALALDVRVRHAALQVARGPIS